MMRTDTRRTEMTGNIKSNEHRCKIQVCLHNLTLRKLKKSIAENHANSNETMNMQDQVNSNLKPLNFESSSAEFSTSKERVDLLQDFQSQQLQLDIRNLSKEPRRVAEKYVRIKENGYVAEIEMLDNAILPQKVQLSLPILQTEPLENMSLGKMMCPKLSITNHVNFGNSGDGHIAINEINRIILKKEIPNNVSFHNDNKRDVHEKKIEDIAKLVSQDVSRIEQTPSDNPIIAGEQLMDSRHYLEIESQKKKSMENKIRNSLRPCQQIIDEPIQNIFTGTNEKYFFFDDSTLDSKLCKECSLVKNQNCTAVSSESMIHIENNVQNKQISIAGKRHFHRCRKYLTNKYDKQKDSYPTTYINENTKDNSVYQCICRYCDDNMNNNLSRFPCYNKGNYDESYERWDLQKGMLGSSRNERRRCICKVHGNSSISCGCKCKVTPSSQRVTFCLPGKKETT